MTPAELAEGRMLVEASNAAHEKTVVPQPIDTDAARWLWLRAAELLDAAADREHAIQRTGPIGPDREPEPAPVGYLTRVKCRCWWCLGKGCPDCGGTGERETWRWEEEDDGAD